MSGLSPHIIFTVTNDLTYDRRMDRICATLSSDGYKVTLVGRKLRHSSTFNPKSFSGVRLTCWFNKGFLFYAEYNLRLFFWLMFHSFTVICACDLDTAFPVRLVSRLKNKKSVLDAHEYFTEVPEITTRPRVKSFWEWIGNTTIPKFDLRYTVGEELAHIMQQRYKVPFDVIRNIAPYNPANSKSTVVTRREKIILYQGALNVGRGLEVLLEAMRQLPDWKLWLAGEGDLSQKLQDVVIQNKLEHRVTFLGWVKPVDLPSLMATARMGINLRDKGSLNDYYSLPNKFFDAIHAGLPSINMRYPEYENINQKYHCAWLVDGLSIDKIVDAVNQLDQHPEQLSELVEGCHRAAKELTWEKEAERLLLLYRALISN